MQNFISIMLHHFSRRQTDHSSILFLNKIWEKQEYNITTYSVELHMYSEIQDEQKKMMVLFCGMKKLGKDQTH